jgi:sigma-E factor negative regulatory protein RseB
MLIRSFSLFALAGVLCASLMPLGGAHAAPSDSVPGAHETKVWLTRIHEAAKKNNFQGTFIVSGGGSVSSARIARFCEGNNQFERIESLDGQARHVFRHNDIVHTLWPQSRVAVVEQRSNLNTFPALLQKGGDRIVEFYEVQLQGHERIAGREAYVLMLRPRDTYRYGYKLWSDQETGLLLRADLLSERSEVLESSAFSDVAIGVQSKPATVLKPMKKLEGYRVVRPVMDATTLEAHGWVFGRPVPGFQQISCVQRPVERGVDVATSGAATPILQTIFSDGVSHVSVFIEPYSADRHTRAKHASVGPTQTLTRRQEQWWITVVGEVPAATLRAFATGFDRR